MKLTNFEQTLKVALWDHQQQQKQQHLSNTDPIFWDHQQENEQQQQKKINISSITYPIFTKL